MKPSAITQLSARSSQSGGEATGKPARRGDERTMLAALQHRRSNTTTTLHVLDASVDLLLAFVLISTCGWASSGTLLSFGDLTLVREEDDDAQGGGGHDSSMMAALALVGAALGCAMAAGFSLCAAFSVRFSSLLAHTTSRWLNAKRSRCTAQRGGPETVRLGPSDQSAVDRHVREPARALDARQPLVGSRRMPRARLFLLELGVAFVVTLRSREELRGRGCSGHLARLARGQQQQRRCRRR